MSRYAHASERDVRRALLVDRYTDATWPEYLDAVKRKQRLG